MGVTYKLRPEIKEFIVTTKEADPALSCRKLSGLVLDKFQIKLSKSAVNSLMKTSGLSLPVGRRPKKRRHKHQPQIKLIEYNPEISPEVTVQIQPEVVPGPEAVSVPEEIEILPREVNCTGEILLKAADYLVGGSQLITEAISTRLRLHKSDILLAKTEALLYKPLFKRFPPEALSSYLDELQGVREIYSDLFRIISGLFRESLCLKAILSDGSSFHLDAQMRTVWSTPQIPYDFSSTLYNLKSYINRYLKDNAPFVLGLAPGYDMPTKEFFDFILSMESKEKNISQFVLYGNRLEELETIRLGGISRRFYVFGLWPWQFGQFRSVKLRGEFRPFLWEPLKNELQIAEAEVDLVQPNTNKRVIFRGCAIKADIKEKIRLIILTNLISENVELEEVARIYLDHWPNLEEGFQDYSRKIELFTYTAASRRFLPVEGVLGADAGGQDIKALFNSYRMALDLYVRWHFLPLGAEDLDFPTINERIYSLNASLKREKDYSIATFQIPQGFSYSNDLGYACRRINEMQIQVAGKRMWLALL